jgi:general secretion pathway protein F
MGVKFALFTGFLLLGTVVRAAIPNLADKIILKIPHYKDLILARQNYVTLYKLGLMVGSGMTMTDTLRFTEFEAPKGALKTDLKRARRFLDEGKTWPNALESMHQTDRAALASAIDEKDQARTLNALANQYRDLYIGKVNSIGPAVEFTSALYLVASSVSLICLTVIPTMQLTASIN